MPSLLQRAQTMRITMLGALEESHHQLVRTAILGLVLSFVGFVTIGIILYLLYVYQLDRDSLREGAKPVSVSFFAFLLGYTLLILILMCICRRYQPRENYDLGYGADSISDPVHLRTQAQRHQFNLGFLTALADFIFSNLELLVDSLRARGIPGDPALAAALLVLAHAESALNKAGPELPLYTPHEVSKMIFYLKRLHLINVTRGTKDSYVYLTEKGHTIFKRLQQEL